MSTEPSAPFLSVIVPTYNRKTDLQALLASLEQQRLSTACFEVIIVDDGSTDGTAGWMTDYMTRSPLRLLFVEQTHQKPGAARNAGIRKASGTFLLFTDSDCQLPADWLATIKATLDADPTIDAFGGPDDASPSFPPLLKAINYAMTSFVTTGGMRGGKGKRLAKYYPRSFNMGVRRDLACALGGFTNLRHGQDIEFSHRILGAGAHVSYIATAPVYHKRRASLPAFFQQVFRWGVARVNLYRIDPILLEPLHVAPAIGFWLALALSTAALFSPALAAIWLGFAGLAALVLVGCGIHAALRWRSPATGLFVPIAMIVQIAGYGLGFTYAFLTRVVFRQKAS